jgi:hypothetical protein
MGKTGALQPEGAMSLSARSAGLHSLVGRLVFRVDGMGYFWEDVVLAARAWGDWASLEQEAREGIACVKHALATDALPSDEELLAAANEFRTAANLRAARQAEAWLRDRGLTVGNWYKYIKRTLLRKRWSSMLAALTERYPARAQQINRAFKIVGICSGHLPRFAVKLAGRAALHARLHAANSLPCAASVPISPAKADRCLRLSAEVCGPKLAHLARLEASWRYFRTHMVTPAAIEAQIAGQRPHWIRIDAQSAAFPDEAEAREAVCCVREDGETIATVAARVNRSLRPERFYLEAVETSLYHRFLAARQGDLLGPFNVAGESRLYFIIDKVLPSATDPEIRQRAELMILQGAIDHEIAARVQWQMRF